MEPNTRYRYRGPEWNATRFISVDVPPEPNRELEYWIAAVIFWSIMSILVVCFNFNGSWIPVVALFVVLFLAFQFIRFNFWEL
ncbi:hypothetical protein BBK36DRAFT_3994 [Trichoderma citrinoviride]|uniref:Uncharacterized protein n=1 Tax=Trichoderma citrinoviride TaxID=58853 RepID=A0A2T4BBY9_9HYPO|nr:hypothetical protein BBK36DRAFT_3994 [Trichoderma citrinoviride]PTB66853.1 hypothetical protein BBK36DRAFT_3994 [Trichoderma citrinoviride]